MAEQREGAMETQERPVGYERPCLEKVLTPAELECEVLYAGPAAQTGNLT